MKPSLLLQFGSHIYGTNLPTSDLDYKGIYVPDAQDILLQKVKGTVVQNTKKDPGAKNGPDDVDTEIFSLQQYLRLLMEGQTVAIDVLFTPRSFYQNYTRWETWELIQENKSRLLHSGCSAFSGYCRQQAAKYGLKGGRVAAIRQTLDFLLQHPDYTRLRDIEEEVTKFVYPGDLYQGDGTDLLIKFAYCKSPKGEFEKHLEVCNRKIPLHSTVKYAREIYQRVFDQYGQRALAAERNEGVDYKALMHAVRVTEEAKELLMTGFVTFPRPERELLLKIRTGVMPYKEIAEVIERGLEEVEECSKRSILPHEPDREFADCLVLEAYGQCVKS